MRRRLYWRTQQQSARRQLESRNNAGTSGPFRPRMPALLSAYRLRISTRLGLTLRRLSQHSIWPQIGPVRLAVDIVHITDEPFLPNIKEVHQIGIWNRIVVGRVCEDDLLRRESRTHATALLDMRFSSVELGCGQKRSNGLRSNLHTSCVVSVRLRERICFSKVPIHGQRIPTECLLYFPSSRVPNAQRTHVVHEPTEKNAQIGTNRFRSMWKPL